MKSVNLLPSWYIQQRRRSKMLRLHLATMLTLGAAMVGASWLSRQRLNALTGQQQVYVRQRDSIRDPQKQLALAQADLHRMEDLRLARKELGNTVPMSAVIQQIRNEMSLGMGLSDFSIDVRSEPVKGSGVVGDPRNPPHYHDVAHLNIIGLAPNDKQITQFIDLVSRNALFEGVTLDFIRTGNLTGYPVRKFEIQIDMDMELLSAADSESVASVSPDATGDGTSQGGAHE